MHHWLRHRMGIVLPESTHPIGLLRPYGDTVESREIFWHSWKIMQTQRSSIDLPRWIDENSTITIIVGHIAIEDKMLSAEDDSSDS